MAADFELHVITCDQDIVDYRLGMSTTIGSKYENIVPGVDYVKNPDRNVLDAKTRLEKTPGVWLGNLSWIKDNLTGEAGYVPSALGKIDELVGEEFPLIDEQLINQIEYILKNETNDTTYHVTESDVVVDFLKQHVGKPVFSLTL